MNTDEARTAARAILLMAALTIGSYAILKALPGWEILATGMRERAREQMRAARAWHRAVSEVLFEAHEITREAAQ